jgi:cellulose biosynthesis protein BcsQ
LISNVGNPTPYRFLTTPSLAIVAIQNVLQTLIQIQRREEGLEIEGNGQFATKQTIDQTKRNDFKREMRRKQRLIRDRPRCLIAG